MIGKYKIPHSNFERKFSRPLKEQGFIRVSGYPKNIANFLIVIGIEEFRKRFKREGIFIPLEKIQVLYVSEDAEKFSQNSNNR